MFKYPAKIVNFVRGHLEMSNFQMTLYIVFGLNLLAFFTYIVFFEFHGYLPGPFLLDKNDTFMDFYHTAFWSNQPGRYSEWKSVYPPLVFLVCKVTIAVADGFGDYIDGFSLREWWPHGAYVVLFIYVFSLWLTFNLKLYSRYDLKNRLLIFLFFGLSSPLLFSIERGNLIVLLVPLLAIALTSNGWQRAIAIVIMINIKPYCVLFLLLYLIKGDIIWFFRAVALSGIVYIFSGLILDQSFHLMALNIVDFSNNPFIFNPVAIESMDSSISVFSYSLEYRYALGIAGFGKESHALFNAQLIRAINIIAIASTLIHLFRKRDQVNHAQVLVFISMIIMNLGVSVGGYSLILYIAAFPVVTRMRLGYIYTGIILVLFLPIDWIVLDHINLGYQNAYLSGLKVMVDEQIGLGSLLRPILNFMMMILVFFEFPLAQYSKERLVG